MRLLFFLFTFFIYIIGFMVLTGSNPYFLDLRTNYKMTGVTFQVTLGHYGFAMAESKIPYIINQGAHFEQ